MANENNETCVEPCINNNILRQDPQVAPIGCYVFNNSSINDTFNGLETLNSPNRPGLLFPDPYTNQNSMNVGHCTKHCIDLMFNYAGLEDGTYCRCGYENALQSYTKVDDKMCNKNCTIPTLKGDVTYPCGGKGAYTVYKAEVQYYTPPSNITIQEKLDIMYNINKEPYYKGCIGDNKVCGKRILGSRCNSIETMTVNECINYCREGNYKYAGLEARVQCFCGNSYDGGVGRLLGSESCSASCPGNNSQICGGSWALSIYEVSTLSTPLTPIPTLTNTTTSMPKSNVLKIGLGVGISVLLLIIIVIV